MSVDRDPATVAMNTRISSVIGEVVKLRRTGNHFEGKCCFHDDRTPSLSVSDDVGPGLFHCFGCGAAGDVFEFVKRYYRMTFREALEFLGGEWPIEPVAPPGQLIKSTEKLKAVRQIWDRGYPVGPDGTVAVYLASRGIPVEELDALENLRSSDSEYRGDGELHPMLVAAIRDGENQLIGVQRTFLTLAGRKLDVPAPKLSFGRCSGGAIKIGEATNEIAICEGLEDALSLRLANPHLTVWAAAGGNQMPRLPIPDACTRLVIARDNDAAGESAADEAERALARPGREIVIMRPSEGFKDFNEELMAETVL